MDVERLLGSMIGAGLRKRSTKSTLARAALSRQGLTLLAGIGIAAYEHFRGRAAQGQSPSPGSGSTGWGGTTGAPPPGPPASAQPGPATPPPFPGARPAAAATPPPPFQTPPVQSAPVPVEPGLMLYAMVQATKADGALDADERARLFAHLEGTGAPAEEARHLELLLAAPLDLDGLVARVHDPATAAEVYAASRLAIDPDTEAERAYLAELARRLGLDPTAVAEIEGRLAEAGAD